MGHCNEALIVAQVQRNCKYFKNKHTKNSKKVTWNLLWSQKLLQKLQLEF